MPQLGAGWSWNPPTFLEDEVVESTGAVGGGHHTGVKALHPLDEGLRTIPKARRCGFQGLITSLAPKLGYRNHSCRSTHHSPGLGRLIDTSKIGKGQRSSLDPNIQTHKSYQPVYFNYLYFCTVPQVKGFPDERLPLDENERGQ